jgi:hypothetical protein
MKNFMVKMVNLYLIKPIPTVKVKIKFSENKIYFLLQCIYTIRIQVIFMSRSIKNLLKTKIDIKWEPKSKILHPN